ncbi:MAG: DUF3604 domain-containing protein [Thermoplasmatales archaeon]|nr:DUF3604 domain-containing protein [Thermoplasmatales archaeon]
MKLKVVIIIITLIMFGSTFSASFEMKNNISGGEIPTVTINIDPNTIVYEGDIINCTITGAPTLKYWTIDDQLPHTTFHGNDPVIFDPEPTPLDTNFVNLTVYAENEFGSASDSIQITIKRIYFGDIHWHSIRSDGTNPLKTMYENAKKDNYLDFACSTEHVELWLSDVKLLIPFNWLRVKNLVKKYYVPGEFTTFLAYEYSGSKKDFGNIQFPLKGDTSHINFYYKDVYLDAKRYPSGLKSTYTKIFKAMSKEWDKGYYNIGFFHHPLAGNMNYKLFNLINYTLQFYVNWTNFINKMKDEVFRDNALKVFRGVEVYSKWGTSIGNYSGIPITWPYNQKYVYDNSDCWVENGMWEWSESPFTRGQPFVLQACSDTHKIDRPGSAALPIEEESHPNPSGIMGALSVHNTREEIWDAINSCNIYGSQLLKIRANVRLNCTSNYDGEIAYGRWINCSKLLKIRITAQSTFPGYDCGGKKMNPHNYSADELDYPIQDIWLIKKDRTKGRPWCKVINHTSPNSDTVVVTFEDHDVQPNDFYYVAIRQKGQELKPQKDNYMAFIGPFFIENAT